MTEFSNRIDAQRHILKIVNSSMNVSEPLLSLSNKSIKRWYTVNQINNELSLVGKITEASEKLFFLANKSQEQITGEYKSISREISEITNEIKILSAQEV